MKLPNRTGSICKLSGKRRKPYMARVYTPDGYAILGYYRLRSEAMTALMTAAGKPPPTSKSPTALLSEIYSQWEPLHAPKVTESTMYRYRRAWDMIEPLHSRPVRFITVGDIETAVAHSDPAPSVRNNIKTLLDQLFRHAMKHGLADSNPATLIDIKQPQETTVVRIPFTYPEVAKLFETDDPVHQAILVGIYTGMRPGELLSLQASEIDLDKQMMYIRGSKTKSGKFRHIPIHPAILSILAKLVRIAHEFDQAQVFTNRLGHRLVYQYYHQELTRLGHTPHDTRHTFITFARKSGLDQLAVKRIIGHSVSDITESIYTHLDDDYLTAQMRKFVIM